MSSQQESGGYEMRRFTPSFEALGIVIDFLSRKAPFDQFRAGHLVTALKHQIAQGHHVCAFRGEVLVGYCGWLQVTCELGELWLLDQAELKPVPPERADAVALTLVRVDEPAAVRPLIRACRRLEPAKRVLCERAAAHSPQYRDERFGQRDPALRQRHCDLGEGPVGEHIALADLEIPSTVGDVDAGGKPKPAVAAFGTFEWVR